MGSELIPSLDRVDQEIIRNRRECHELVALRELVVRLRGEKPDPRRIVKPQPAIEWMELETKRADSIR